MKRNGYRQTRDNAGLKDTRRNRQTTTLISIYDAAAAGIDANGERYSLVCEPHGTILAAATLEYARRFAAVPLEWCPDCRVNYGGVA